jgi:hypothetical protein
MQRGYSEAKSGWGLSPQSLLSFSLKVTQTWDLDHVGLAWSELFLPPVATKPN